MGKHPSAPEKALQFFNNLSAGRLVPGGRYVLQKTASQYYFEHTRTSARTTKLVKAINKWSYEERLAYLGLYSLERRRSWGDLIETFKILNGVEVHRSREIV